MNRVVVINVVGLCDRHIGPDMPFLSAFCERTQHRHIDPAFPAVTCTARGAISPQADLSIAAGRRTATATPG